MNKNIIEHLKNRNLLHQCSDLKRLVTIVNTQSEPLKAYIGIDPTADSLHVGHLTAIILAKRFEMFNIPVIFILGDRTGKIGDPTGKDKIRKTLDHDNIQANTLSIGLQLKKLGIKNENIICNSLNPISIEEVANKFSVNQFLTHNTFKDRIEAGEPLSINEFLYPILQSIDFLWLKKKHGVNIQIGGSDQWFNMTQGLHLVKDGFVITTPLLLDNKGNKFGKSEGNAIWLDINKTSFKKFFDFWRSVRDEDVKKLLLTFTFLDMKRIDMAIGNINTAKEILAFEICKMVHPELTNFSCADDFSKYMKGVKNETNK